MKADRQVTVLLVDDHALVRRGVRAFLATQSDILVVAEAETGEEAVRQVSRHHPNVALVDLLLPDSDGVETTRRLLAVSPDTKVVILTSYHRDEHIFPALRAGARSYLIKDIGPEELAEAVRRSADGEAVLDPRIAARVVGHLQSGKADRSSLIRLLTDRELEVLRLIAAGRSNREIAETLFISEKTVKSHVGSIFGKLDVTDRTQAAVCAWREGLLHSDW